MSKTAVILFNLGGPDSLEAVEPFLFNLFNDPAIIGAPSLIRRLLARFISKKRGPVAREIYAQIGGKSPLVEETDKQARALEQALGEDYRVFVAMRYWHPFAAQALQEARQWGAERVVLLPLYPQFSTTTSRSSLREWRKLAADWPVPTEAVCCYPDEKGLVAAIADWTSWRTAMLVLGAIGLLLLFGFAMIWVGATLGLYARTTETANVIGFMIFFPISFVSNAFVPTSTMPPVLQTIAEWNPVSATTAACRELFGNPNPMPADAAWPMQNPVLASILGSLLILAIFMPLALRRYNTTASR